MVSDEDFVNKWIDCFKNGYGLKVLAVRVGMEYVKASARASSLRRAGVKLPTMVHNKQELNGLKTDVDKLNNIIADRLGKEALLWRNR